MPSTGPATKSQRRPLIADASDDAADEYPDTNGQAFPQRLSTVETRPSSHEDAISGASLNSEVFRTYYISFRQLPGVQKKGRGLLGN